jgi:hypothetical protein
MANCKSAAVAVPPQQISGHAGVICQVGGRCHTCSLLRLAAWCILEMRGEYHAGDWSQSSQHSHA